MFSSIQNIKVDKEIFHLFGYFPVIFYINLLFTPILGGGHGKLCLWSWSAGTTMKQEASSVREGQFTS